MSADHLPGLQGQPEFDARVWGLLGDYGGERLPLLTAAEAQAAVLLLQVLASGDGEGREAASDLVSRIARRLPAG